MNDAGISPSANSAETATLDNSEDFWRARRAEMLLEPGKVQLNNGSFAPLPKPVAQRLAELHAAVAAGPSNFYWREQPRLLDEARRMLANYVDGDPNLLLLIFNTTLGINLVADSLDLPAGSEILMTDQEYGACRYCWMEFANRRGWTIREAAIPSMPDSPEEIVDAIRSSIGPATKALFFSHVTSPTGLVLPARELCALARERGLVSVVDAAHAPAMVPVSVRKIDADFYAGNFHKWLLAPSGSAFLYVRAERRAAMRPTFVSWGWDSPRDRPDEDSGWGGSHWQRYIEFPATLDRCPQIATTAAVDYRTSLGEERIADRVHKLVRYVRQGMAAVGFECATPASRELSGTLTAFVVPPIDVVAARNWIWHEHGIECPFTTSAGRFQLRVSTAWFNNEDDLVRLFAAMRDFDPSRFPIQK